MRGLMSWLMLGMGLFGVGLEEVAWAGGGMGLLPLQGAPPTSSLSSKLRTALAKQVEPGRFFEPHELRALLLQRREVKEAVAFAESRAARSEAAFLKMDRPGAVGAAREALERLGLTAGRVHSPRLVLRAEVALALALLLDPAAPELARRALAQALAIDPTLSPDPDRFAPRARALLTAVKSQPRGIEEPELAQLRAVARLADLEQLLWVGQKASSAAGVAVKVLVFRRSKGQVVLRLQQRVEKDGRERAILFAVKRALAPGPQLASRPVVSPLPHSAPAPAPPPRARPWYRRWWVWTLAAAAIAGGVTAAVVASSSDGSGVTMHLDL